MPGSTDIWQQIEKVLLGSMKEQGGFKKTLKTLKQLNRSQQPKVRMMSVSDGAIEELPSGEYDAALQTDSGPLMLRGAKRQDQFSRPIDSEGCRGTSESVTLTADELLSKFTDAGRNPSRQLVCAVELTRFNAWQRQQIIPLLREYIFYNRDSDNRSDLVTVGAAIRKYVAIIPMDQMGELALMFEPGHRVQMPIDLEIEVIKGIYRNFEVHPPVNSNACPELAQQLLLLADAYINPYVLLRGKHSAASSLAIEAIVSMRSDLAKDALDTVAASPFRWLAELVSDDLDRLHLAWQPKNSDAAAWLCELRAIPASPIRR